MGARVMVVWCPDWPVVAALWEAGMPAESARRVPAAVLEKGRIGACSAAARETGVRRGMRKRDAQSGCPDLRLLDAAPDRDARAFEPILAAVEELRPGVAPLRPGLLALRSPGVFYGGDAHAGAVLAEQVVTAGAWDCRVGVADDLFTAEQAARRAAPQETEVVAPGGSAAYLAGLPVEVVDTQPDAGDLVSLLRRLGLRTLGDLAALPADAVGSRFGAYGAWLHRAVSGAGTGVGHLGARTPPPELAREQVFEPAVDNVEVLSFSIRRTADAFVAGLAHHGLAATEVRVEVETEDAPGVAVGRDWLHPRVFTAADLVDRLHWQLSGSTRGRGVPAGQRTGTQVGSPVTLVRFVPVVAVGEATHAEGLWGGSTDERVARGLAKVQGILGHDAVLVPVLQGGRGPADRQALVPYGERPVALRDRALPWPGRLPDPQPARVLAEPWPAAMVTGDGRPVVVDDRGAMSGVPGRFRTSAAEPWQPVAAWAGPWPVEESWWEEGGGSRLTRFQVVGVDGRAWLLALAGTEWWTEAGYD
ncbi:DNA polymerase Y family protein [uncultured Nocardioides sp.]|uniref:DNA polymerase Y family protein n=1 Tax=uncultured Nocardioides sp. TaxID=198441 RepID=UPI0026330091|nr:DNA polymerase Y family protein [uncultured Nocardioides sp.]